MALDAPNYFDEFERIRTPSQPYDPRTDYSRIIQQLRDACHRFTYLGVSPQNLAQPAELLPVVVIRQVADLRNFVNPQIVKMTGKRLQRESCANLFLVQDGKKEHIHVLTERPTFLTLSYVHAKTGRKVVTSFCDTLLPESTRHSMLGVICHELDHLRGRLLVDIARDRLARFITNLRNTSEESAAFKDACRIYIEAYAPYVLRRDGDGYVLQHGIEFEHEPIPTVSPDAMFIDLLFHYRYDWSSIFVPRGGELLPIRPSKIVLKLAAR